MTGIIKVGQREYDLTVSYEEVLLIKLAMFIALEEINREVLENGFESMKNDLEKLKKIYIRWDDELSKYVW